MEIKWLDHVKVVRMSDEEQLAEIEFSEAQKAFCAASCRWADTNHPHAIEVRQHAEIKLMNCFLGGENNPLMRNAWACYRRRLLYHHRAES